MCMTVAIRKKTGEIGAKGSWSLGTRSIEMRCTGSLRVNPCMEL